jgi:hypothetical protein
VISYQEKIEKWYPEICSNIYCGASIPPEWEDIVTDALEELRHYPISVAQIKSKFGGLRIYVDFTLGWSDVDIEDVNKIIEKAEDYVDCLTMAKKLNA